MAATMTSVSQRTSSLAAPLACGACLAAGAAYIAANDPADGAVPIPCPFRALTGMWCPGCGLTRATHHLLRGDVVQALRYNAFVVLVLVAIATSWLAWTMRSAGRPVMRRVSIPTWATLTAIATLFAFAVVRNTMPLPLTG